MRSVTSLLMIALASACSTTELSFSVSRYDLDRVNPDTGVAEARATYEKVHPKVVTLGKQWQDLVMLRDSVQRYRNHLVLLNRLAQSLFSEEKAVVEAKDPKIAAAFAPFEAKLEAEIARIQTLIADRGPLRATVPLDPALFLLWRQLPGDLRAEKVTIDATKIETLLAQIEQIGGEEFLERVRSVRNGLAALDPTDANIAGLGQTLDRLESSTTGESALSLAAEAAVAQKSRVDDATVAIQKVTGDLVPRLHAVYQDMSDPFLTYLAAHPENWQELPNMGSVKGSGDTEFILVFENNLDGRWKRVSVDPTKVIQARLQLARRVASSLTAIGGIAAKAYGVPLPSGMEGSGAENGSIDFSKMTGEAKIAQARNDLLRQQLSDLQTYALSQLEGLDATNAARVRDQLVRRLEVVVKPD